MLAYGVSAGEQRSIKPLAQDNNIIAALILRLAPRESESEWNVKDRKEIPVRGKPNRVHRRPIRVRRQDVKRQGILTRVSRRNRRSIEFRSILKRQQGRS